MTLGVLLLTVAAGVLLSTIHRIAAGCDGHREHSQLERRLTGEIVNNIFYTMLAGSLTAVSSFFTLCVEDQLAQGLLTFFFLFLAAEFILALFMVFNRARILIVKTCAGSD